MPSSLIRTTGAFAFAGLVAALVQAGDLAERLAYLNPRLVVASGNTLEELVAQAKPTVRFNHNGLIRAKTDAAGSARFTVAKAYRLQVGQERAAWYILNDQLSENELGRAFATSDWRTRFIFAEVGVSAKIPISDSGSGNFAFMLSQDPTVGRLYELGCQEGPAGSGGCTTELRVFLLRRNDNTWQFIGEGPPLTSSHGGWAEGRTAKFDVRWTPKNDSPVAVGVTVRTWIGPAGMKDDFTPIIDLETYRDATLTLDCVIWKGTPYCIARKGETLPKIAQRVGAWARYFGDRGSTMSMDDATRIALDAITALNATLHGNAPLRPGTQVFVPDA